MKLWEIILPCETNEGESYQHAHAQTRAILLDSFGGYTAVDVDGGWLDKAIPYEEPCVSYRILSDDKPLLGWAFELFPDQLAIYIACIGEGEIVQRRTIAPGSWIMGR